LLFLVIINPIGGIKSMNISLTPHFEELVKGKVESGLYNSASEVMREALRLLEERDQLRNLRLEELRGDIQKGIDGGEATPLDMEEIKARGRKRLAAQKGEG
jgi:antitoxin ParD1/3/4